MTGERPGSQVMPRGVRTYKPRRSRPTARARRALASGSPFLLPYADAPIELDDVFADDRPVVLDLGFGDGYATSQMAADQPDLNVLAVDVHTPGVGELLARLDEAALTNVRVVEGDALVVLERLSPGSLCGVRTFFPDPWPKARHHKRRLVQPPVAALVRSRLVPGGWWHLATDWADYADDVRACLDGNGWAGGPIPRPDDRPVTRYERRALEAGRAVTDLRYRTID